MVFEVRINAVLNQELAGASYCTWSAEASVHKGTWNFYRPGS